MMTKSRIQGALLAASAAAVLSLTGAALAEDAPVDDLRMDEAWADLVVDQEPILTDVQFAKLNNLAFQAAVTKICDGYQLDQMKFAEGVSDATSPAPDDHYGSQPHEAMGNGSLFPSWRELRRVPGRRQLSPGSLLRERCRAQGGSRGPQRLAVGQTRDRSDGRPRAPASLCLTRGVRDRHIARRSGD